MRNLSPLLLTRLENARRVAFLGIGSEMRSDDAAGLYAVALIAAGLKKHRIRRARVFFGHTAPENLTAQIRKFGPGLTVMIDASDFGKEPGEVGIVDLNRARGASYSTHRLPMAVFADYLQKTAGCECVLVGIQPASIRYGQEMSPAVRKSCAALGRACVQSVRGGRNEGNR